MVPGLRALFPEAAMLRLIHTRNKRSADGLGGTSSSDESGDAMSDVTLVQQLRAGDARALAELWRRHYRSGVRVARQYGLIAVDDRVAEAFIQCCESQLAGRGLAGAFRPRLYAAIRTAAAGPGAGAPVDALSRTATARAFGSLPDRWRAVLWYLEVEGLDPHEAAPLLGMEANSTAELLYRARAGMRSAWLRTYASDAADSGSDHCRWAVVRLELFSAGSLCEGDRDRVMTHLVQCAKCSMIHRQVADVTSRLAVVLIPLVLGAEAGGRYLGLFGTARKLPEETGDVPPTPSLALPVP